MNVDILSIGDELLIGQVINTNATFISSELQKIGGNVRRVISVGDEEEMIVSELNQSFKQSDVIIITGGLGPTHDDITKKVIAKYLNRNIIFNEEAFERCKKIFESRGIKMPESNRSQGEVIEDSTVLQNDFGTAPGMFVNFKTDIGNKYIVILPGVPLEMKDLLVKKVIPLLKPHSKLFIKHTTIRTIGIGESLLAEKIGNVTKLLAHYSTLAFLPGSFGVRLRISTKSSNEEVTNSENIRIKNILFSLMEKNVYADEDLAIEEVIGKILTKKLITISSVESCTGGLIANRITNIAGSSAYFIEGRVAYHNEAKMRLGVRRETLDISGAVSEEIAIELATCMRKTTNTDIAISTTGIAGPDGGSKEKPVGTVWIGISTNEKFGSISRAKKFRFFKDRMWNKDLFSEAAFSMIREVLNEHAYD